MNIQAPTAPPVHTAKGARRRLATAQDVAEYLNLPLSTLYDRARTVPPTIPGVVRIGRRLRFDLDAIEEWVDAGGGTTSADTQ